MGKAIHDKDLNLLKHSEITKLYPELLEVMTKYPDIELEKLKSISITNYNFFKNVYSRVKNQAIAEWTGALDQDIVQVDKSKKVKCELCNTTIINVCTIKNIKNNKKMNIGIDCNNRFNFIDKIELSNYFGERNKIRKINKILIMFPEFSETMSNWNKIILGTNLYIPHEISEEYMEIKEKILDIHKEYINKNNLSKKYEDNLLNEIKKLLDKSIISKKKIKKYIDINKNNILYPTKKMVESLKYSNNYKTSKEFLDEDGKIRLRTLYRFRDSEFAQKISNIFNESLEKEAARIIDVYKEKKDNLGYNISFDINKRCKFYYKYEYICELFGASVTGESENIEEFNKENFIKKGELLNNESIEEGLDLMENKLYNTNIELMEYYHNFGEVLWKVLKDGDDEKAKFYYKTNIDKLRGVLKDLLLSLKKYDGRDIYNIIKINSSKVNNDEIRDFLRARNSA